MVANRLSRHVGMLRERMRDAETFHRVAAENAS